MFSLINAKNYIKKVLAETHHEKAAVRPPTTHQKTIQVRRTRYAGTAGEEWRIPYMTPSRAGRPTTAYLPQLCKDTGCSLKALPGTINHRGE